MANKTLTGRIALVTGASRGIGFAVARRFAQEGAHVIATARTVGGLEELDDLIKQDGAGECSLVPMDVREKHVIEQLGATLAQRFGRLDVLVGNAGMLGELSELRHVTDKVWQQVMDVNVTANWRFIRALDPLLRMSDAGRAMFVTSGVTQGVMPFWGAYSISKVALEHMALTYAEEVRHTAIKVNLVDPGVVRTHMRATAMPGEDASTLPTPEDITDRFVELASARYSKTAQRVDV